MSRPLPNPSRPNANSWPFPSSLLPADVCLLGGRQAASRVTALSVEFVAKPEQAHKVQWALPAAINNALGEVAGFAGGFVLIANCEARLVTVVTLWMGEDRLERCNENLKWVRALLAPYLDRCLRVQTLAAYVPEVKSAVQEIVPCDAGESSEIAEDAETAIYAA